MGLGSNFKLDKLIPTLSDNQKLNDKPEIISTGFSQNNNDSLNKSNLSENRPNEIEPLVLNNFSIQFIPSRRKTTKRITLVMEGEFSINHISAIHNRIIEILKDFDYLDVVLKNISKIEITALQLLYFIKNSEVYGHKHLTFQNEINNETKLLLRKCGFENLLINESLIK